MQVSDHIPPFPVPVLTPALLHPLIASALAEDIGTGDLTGTAVIAAEQQGRFRIVAREALVVAGMPVAEATFRMLDPAVQVFPHVQDGMRVAAGSLLAEVAGPARSLLASERTALNFLQFLSAIATLTHQYVTAIAHSRARLLDTRKTVPGLRVLSKYATHVGGAWNHRLRLDEALMLKDNHLALCAGATLHGGSGHGGGGAGRNAADGGDGLAGAIHTTRAFAPGKRLIVECDTLAQAAVALAAGAEWLLLDNMTLAALRQGVGLAAGRAVIEASGGVHLDSIAAIAATGVDYISCGRITSAAGTVDIGLDWE
jgi:nicotinate-nucleotide pyrophosphorylase (carboxylating)